MNHSILSLFFLFQVTIGFSQESVAPDREKIRGYENSISLETAVQKLNAAKPTKKLEVAELEKAIIFERSQVSANNNKDYEILLWNIIENKKLPAGSLLYFRWFGEYEQVILLIGLDLQPADMVPEPGSIEKVRRIPVRIDFSNATVKK